MKFQSKCWLVLQSRKTCLELKDALKAHLCGCWQDSLVPLHMSISNELFTTWFPQSKGSKRMKNSNPEGSHDVSCNLISAVTFHQFCHLLLVIQTNPCAIGERMTQARITKSTLVARFHTLLTTLESEDLFLCLTYPKFILSLREHISCSFCLEQFSPDQSMLNSKVLFSSYSSNATWFKNILSIVILFTY